MGEKQPQLTDPKRRYFFRTCASAAAIICANPDALGREEDQIKYYFEVRLTHGNGEPITSKDIQKNRSYIFNYPFVTTPCFLINLGRPLERVVGLSTKDDQSYTWTGGVGPNQSIVAFSAICSHKMSYPTRTLSFINYRSDEVHYRDEESAFQKGSQLIYCCSERSAYDPAQGAAVLGGPATQPLTTDCVTLRL
ncbi:MAG: hypothetical protein GKR96_06975 [Gammaproteobacteria bacterium]|nr:hypothetical protein [Gammaproteobacteria bacterium]